jgi:hypothetical protein
VLLHVTIDPEDPAPVLVNLVVVPVDDLGQVRKSERLPDSHTGKASMNSFGA